MAGKLKDLAKEQMLEKKRKAREEARKAAQKIKDFAAKEKAEQKARRDYEKSKRDFAKRIQAEVLRPHYRSRAERVIKGDLYIAKSEDGNIYGKNGNEYFMSCQDNDKTYIKVFVVGKRRIVSDGDHYPQLMQVDSLEAKRITITPFGRVDLDSVYVYDVLSDSFYGKLDHIDEYPDMKKVIDKVEMELKELKELQNTSKR